MRFWWVNQNQTFEQEFGGGYLWSPKRNAAGHRNPFYDFMRDVSPGDIVFSFAKTRIPALGIAQSTCIEAPKPEEFGNAGQNWSRIGWKVPVHFIELTSKVRPADHMAQLGPLLPPKYAPLQANGRGLQSVYLAALPDELGRTLVNLIGKQARDIVSKASASDLRIFDPDTNRETLDEWEDHVVAVIENDVSLSESERIYQIKARRGQGRFRENVFEIEKRCRITKVDRLEHLVASHSKPWRHCESTQERLDGHNGLLLTPSVDHLFDSGFISFERNGKLLISPVVHRDSIRKMGIDDSITNVGPFSLEQDSYLQYHREQIFKCSGIG